MPTKAIGFLMILLCSLFSSGCTNERISLWERHCAACHDGKTVLNRQVVINKEQMKAKYKTLKEFSNACSGSAACMNILKHDKKLFIEAGRELGIKE